MASAKKDPLILRCTGISLLGDGRQQVTMQKSTPSPTAKLANATVVNPPEAMLVLTIDAADSGNYAVGKDYTVTMG